MCHPFSEVSIDDEGTRRVQLVTLRHYCSLTGDTPQAVHSRRKRGEWVDDKHCYLVKGRRLWIDIEEANKWIRNGGMNQN
jgi:hypothetical protein